MAPSGGGSGDFPEPGARLTLNLVYNPGGDHLPPRALGRRRLPLRVEPVLRVDPPLPFEPALPRGLGVEIVFDREPELEMLDRAWTSDRAELIVVYGRRRVGKTFLVREFFGDSVRFELTGLHNASLSDQLENFAEALGKAMGHGIMPRPPASWREAFRQLEQFLESSPSSGGAVMWWASALMP